MKIRKFYSFFVLGIASLFLISCVTTKIEFADTDTEMSIVTAEDGKLENKHYSAEDLRAANVLVLDTKNTNRSIEMVDKLSADMIKYHNKKAAEDCNTKAIIEYQNNQLKKIFHSVAFEGKSGETYDFVILRDCYILPGKMSKDTTGTVLAYQFVYPVTEDLEIAEGSKFLFRGFVSFEGYGTIPYPATSYAVQDSNKNAADAVTSKLLGSGIDLLRLPGDEERKFTATEESLAALTKEVETQPEMAEVGVNAGTTNSAASTSSVNSSAATSAQSSVSSGKSTAYTSARFKALLEKQ
ncbi:MAG: hypothetical protein IJ558_05720 [Treponema sp.]|nr:hypothetical protein [Treponema sp.]